MQAKTVMRTAATVAALSGGLVAGSRSAGGLPGGSALAAPPGCANYQLLIKPVASNAGAGHVSEMFRIHDLLPSSCTLFGYPGALLLDQTFYSLPTRVTWRPYPAGGPGPALVTLDRSHDAYFVLSWVHFPTPGQRCPIARYVMITAPNDHLPVVTNAGRASGEGGIMACGGNLTVSPVAGKRFWAR